MTTVAARSIAILPIESLPEFAPGMSVGEELIRALCASGRTLAHGDIVVVAHKIISKSEGRVVALSEVVPSKRALEYAERLGKDPAKVELILRESRRVIAAKWTPGKPEGVMICEHRLGFVSANAGVDESNAGGPGLAILLPEDPDASAEKIRGELEEEFELGIGVIVSDTFGRAWRIGLVNVAIGVAGLPAVVDLRGTTDADGRTLTGSVVAVADELAAAAGLAMGKSDTIPAVIMRGVDLAVTAGRAADLLRPEREDLFR